MHKLFILFIFLFAGTANAQEHPHDNPVVKSVLDSLKKNGIDSVLIFCEGSQGCYVVGDNPCKSENDFYIFYKYHSKCFLRRYDGCSVYKTIKLSDTQVIDYYYENKKVLAGKGTYNKRIKESMKKNKVVFLPPVTAHFFYNSIFFSTYKDSIYLVVRDTEYDKNGNPLYIKSRWMRKQKEWADFISSKITSLDRNTFIKDE